MSFDPTKPVMTRDGHKARIICTDRAAGAYGTPIVALVTNSDGVEAPFCYTKEGRLWLYPPVNSCTDTNLVNIEHIRVEVDVWRRRDTGYVFTASPAERGGYNRTIAELIGTRTLEFTLPEAPQKD